MRILLTLFIFAMSLPISWAQDDGINLTGNALFGSLRARQIGPALMSGRTTDIEGHPSNPKIIYIGTAGGGVWKSEDGAINFRPIFDKYNQSIGRVALDPNDPDNTIWVGTGEIWTRNSTSVGDGLYRSTDGGKSWKHMGFKNAERISGIEIHPENSKHILVGVLGPLWGASKERGIYETTDGGETWNQIFHLDDDGVGCSDLIRDPNNPDVLYAAFWEFRRTPWSFSSGGYKSGLYKSIDGGKNWNKIHNGFPSGKLGRLAIAVAPSNSDILYSVVESEKAEDKGLYKSEDAGQSWKHINSDFELTVRPFYFSRLVVSPHDENKLCKAGVFGAISEDGGSTFRSVGGGVHADIHDYHFDINNKDRLYLACDGGTYRSYDGGYVWDMVKGLPLSQYYHVTVDMETPFNVYGGLQDNGSWVGPSSKAGGVLGRHWLSVGYGDGFRVYPHPDDPNIVYSEMQGAENVWRVDIDKNSAKVIKPYPEEGEPKLRFNWNAPICTSPHQSDRLYIGSQFVHVSEDQGESWRKISPDLTTNDKTKQNQEESGGLSKDNSGAENHCTIFTIAESALDENVIWAGTDDGNIQITKDGGATWTNVRPNVNGVPAGTWVYHMEPSAHDLATAYAVFDGHTLNDHNTYVYRTTDYGQTWTSIAKDNIESFARSIQEDLVNPDILYLGTEMGLYVTIDGGIHWSKFESNMPSVPVHHLTLHPRDHSLVMATHGRGVIIIDDVRPLRKINEELLSEPLTFIDMGAQVVKEPGSFGGYALAGEFVGENPSPNAQIVYFMKSRHTFGKMSMQVFDENGFKVAELSPGKSKGINIVEWNGQLPMPKIAKAKTFTFGGFTTPRVPAGDYTVVIKKGKETYKQTIRLEADPNSIHTDADRQLQYEKAMELYRMNEDLAYVMDQVEQVNERAESLKSFENKKVAKLARTVLDDATSFKKSVVVTEGDNYVGQVDPELREKIASLYGEVAGYSGKPSKAQLANLDLLKSQLEERKVEWGKQMEVIKKLNTLLEKAGQETIQFQSKAEFLGLDKS